MFRWKRKADDGRDEMNRDPIWYRAMEGDTTALRRRLDDGFDVNHADRDGMTMLAVAVHYGRSATVELLIERGADVNLPDRHGNGPLWVATREAIQAPPDGRPSYGKSIVAKLLAAGADPDHRNKAGRTPPGWADGASDVQVIYREAGYRGDFSL